MIMGLNHSQFLLMQQGDKSVEIRLNDRKRSFLKDLFKKGITDLKTDKKIEVIVKKIYKFKTFCELYKSFTSTEVGSATNDSLEKMVNDTYKIYSPAQERNFGVLAIRIRLIH